MSDSIVVTPTIEELNVYGGDRTLGVTFTEERIQVTTNTANITASVEEVVLGVNATIDQTVVSGVEIEIIPVAEQGPPGPPGPSSDSTETATAGETISALKPIVIVDGEAFVADSTDDSHRGFLAGIAITAASIGEEVTIQTAGRLQDSFWNWDTTKPWIFYGAGVLTQSPPDDWSQPIARVEDADTIFINVIGGIERA